MPPVYPEALSNNLKNLEIMGKKKNLNQWLEAFKAGKFNSADIDTQIEAGWYDWFCKDGSLQKKTVVLGKKLEQIIKSDKLSPEKQYVFFKNNCPVSGTLYDDFRICDIESGNVVYTIIPKNGHKAANGQAEVWGRQNDFKEPLFTGTWKEVKDWFLGKSKKWYLGARHNPQFKQPYYVAYGQLSVKDALDKEECVYGSMSLTGYDTEYEYKERQEFLKKEGFRVNVR